jgi:error-prone DNA polymerase
LKIDVLALGMLTAVQKCLRLVSAYSDEELTIQKIPAEDPKVYDMMGEADTVGVFQIESRAQMSMLPRLLPRNYYDLVIQIAIVRPGPIQGDMVHPYLARRSGKEQVTYPSEEVRTTLERTMGVPIFQEQVMQLAMVAAGFSGGEADQLRRAMAAWKKKDGLEPYRDKLIQGMLERGYELSFAEQLFRQIQGFGDYGFPESHSASFALIAYVSSWLKCYHPAAFCCALLNSQPMGFYAPAQLVQDARLHGVEILPVSVNNSFYDCTLNADDPSDIKLRIGFNQVKGLSETGGRAVVEAREQQSNDAVVVNISPSTPSPFSTVQDLVFRSGINKKDLEALAAADALRELSGDRHRAFWFASGVERSEKASRPVLQDGSQGELADGVRAGAGGGMGGEMRDRTRDETRDEIRGRQRHFAENDGLHSSASKTGAVNQFFSDDFGVDVLLPVATESQNIVSDYTATGFTLRRHPLALLRQHLNNYQVSCAGNLQQIDNEGFAKAVGIVTCRQRPMTASGVTFITMEDESGFVNVVVWPALGERQRPVLRQAKLMGVTGHVQHSDGVTHLIATELVDLSHWLGEMQLSSRDFT